MSNKVSKEIKKEKITVVDDYEDNDYYIAHLKKPNRTEKSNKRKILSNVSEDEWS